MLLLSQGKLNSCLVSRVGVGVGVASSSSLSRTIARAEPQTPSKQRELDRRAEAGNYTLRDKVNARAAPRRYATIRDEYTHTHARAHAGVELIYLRAGGISRGRSLTRARDTRAERRALIRNSNSGAICNGMKYASLFRKRSAEIIRGRDSTDPDEIKGTRETQAAEIRRAALPSARQLVLNTLSVETIRQGISMFPFRRISGQNLPSQLHSLAILISARNGAR